MNRETLVLLIQQIPKGNRSNYTDGVLTSRKQLAALLLEQMDQNDLLRQEMAALKEKKLYEEQPKMAVTLLALLRTEQKLKTIEKESIVKGIDIALNLIRSYSPLTRCRYSIKSLVEIKNDPKRWANYVSK